MSSSKFQTALYSSVGVGLVFVALIGANIILSPVRARVDLTADKLHTLSPGTKAILAKVDAPIQIRFYSSQGKDRMPAEIKSYVQTVDDLLSEFRAQAGGKIEIRKLDPEPDSEAEELARVDGIEPQLLRNGEQLYLGLIVEYAPQKSTIPFLSPQREKLLEYDLARAVSEVVSTNRPVVGVMSPLQVMGGFNPMAMQMGRQGQSEPWVIISELKRQFQVQNVPMDSEKIDDAIKVMVLLHPKEISDKAQYALDQFVLRGGKLIAFLDPLCLADNRQPNQMGLSLGGGSSIPKLLKAWGLEFDTTKVVADQQFMRQLSGRDGRPQLVPSFLFMNADGVTQDDPVTGQTDDLWIPFAGAFTGKVADGLRQDVLLHTSRDSQLVDAMTAQINGQKIVDDFKASGVSYTLATRLYGKFKTAFPDGKPAADKKEAKPDEAKTENRDGESLKESKVDGVVYLFGDADFLYDPYCVEVNQMLRVAMPRNGNLGLFQNLIEQAAGDSNLIGARSRATVRRTFTVVQKMETEARQRYQAKIEGLDKKQQELQTKLADLQIKKEGNTAKVILTPEQQQAIKTYNTDLAATKKELRIERRNLRQDVDALENRLKWANILLMPVVVSFTGLTLAVLRRKRTAAK